MSDRPDVDIDVAHRDKVVEFLADRVVIASQITERKYYKMVQTEQVPHNSGVYLQHMPRNPLNGLAVFPYKLAHDLGFHKIDILQNGVYNNVSSVEEIRQLLKEPIDWSWFKDAGFVSTLFQLGNHADTVLQYEPKSILDLACLIALIRPSKRHLIGQEWDVVRAEIYKRPESGNFFKKSHAVAYAIAVGLDARVKAKKYFSRSSE